MATKIAIIGDQDTLTGFELAGIKEIYRAEITDEKSVAEVERILKNLLRREDIGLILITERIADKLRKTIEEIEVKKEEVFPIIIEIPDKKGPVQRVVLPLQKLVRRAIGIEVVLGDRKET